MNSHYLRRAVLNHLPFGGLVFSLENPESQFLEVGTVLVAELKHFSLLMAEKKQTSDPDP